VLVLYFMRTKLSKGRRGQVFLVVIFLLVVLVVVIVGAELLSQTGGVSPVQGQPKKDTSTGLYTVYLVVNGHRDLTIFHVNFHANIHLDFVTYYFTTAPTLPSGQSWIDFSKPIHVTVTVTSSNPASTLLNTFDMSVYIGAHWGQALTYTLPSGNYTIDAQGVDQDGFRSSSTTQLILP
jgi:hypothetical protein